MLFSLALEVVVLVEEDVVVVVVVDEEVVGVVEGGHLVLHLEVGVAEAVEVLAKRTSWITSQGSSSGNQSGTLMLFQKSRRIFTANIQTFRTDPW